MRYIEPGMSTPPPPAAQPNAYRPPSGPLQQLVSTPAQQPSPPPPPHHEPQPEPPDNNPHRALLAEWRAHHGSDWVRADDLAPPVRRLIDERERLPAVRQRLRRLVASCPELEARVVGNAARLVAFYRVIERETA